MILHHQQPSAAHPKLLLSRRSQRLSQHLLCPNPPMLSLSVLGTLVSGLIPTAPAWSLPVLVCPHGPWLSS